MNYVIENTVKNIIEKLEQKIIPWQSPYRKTMLPHNYISKKNYNGINYFNLFNTNFVNQAYLTFLQCKELGGKIKKGAKAFDVVYWFNIEDEEKEKTFFRCKTHKVFNIEQTDLAEEVNQTVEINNKAVDALISKFDIAFKKTDHAYYSISENKIYSPERKFYKSDDEYYATILHEITHSTINLRNKDIQTAEDRILEELIAELTSNMLCQTYGVLNNQENTENYCINWLQNLSGSATKLILKAVKQSKIAYDYIISTAQQWSWNGTL